MFGRRKQPLRVPLRDVEDVRAAALDRAIRDRKSEDPLAGVKVGAAQLYANCLGGLESERGVHAETLVGVLGALAGFAIPAAISELVSRTGQSIDTIGVVTVAGRDGRTFWFGNLSNALLLEQEPSVWSMIADQARALGAASLPDPEALIGHVAATAGGELFGMPRLPAAHMPHFTPLLAAQAGWPKTRLLMLRYCDDPREWPLLATLAVMQAQREAAEVIDPALAAVIAAEYAFPMAKLAPGSLGSLPG